MSVTSYINVFLKTEITIIPGLLDKYVGNYYNNTLCNGATWMFVLWYFLHLLFDNFLNALLKKMRYKDHARTRLKNSLWYIGFYCAALLYSCATLVQYSIPLLNVRFAADSATSLSPQLILGFVVLTTFYLHSALWEALKYEHRIIALRYFVLFLCFFCSYYVRFIEGALKLTILICITQVFLEVARCVAVLVHTDKLTSDFFVKTVFMITITSFTMNSLVIIPYILGHSFFLTFTPSAILLLVLVVSWLMLEIYNSVLFKAAYHRIHHRNCENVPPCKGNIVECSLFIPRDDVAYNVRVFYDDIKERQEHFMTLRRPRRRNMVVQTLKCMIALKRKLNQRRQASSTTEQSEELQLCENKLLDQDSSDPESTEDITDTDESFAGGQLRFNEDDQDTAVYSNGSNGKAKED